MDDEIWLPDNLLNSISKPTDTSLFDKRNGLWDFRVLELQSIYYNAMEWIKKICIMLKYCKIFDYPILTTLYKF